MAIAFGVNTSTRGALRDRNAYMQVGQTADRLGYGFLSINDHVVVPRCIEHRTCADQEAEILLIEPTGIVNTGNVTDVEFTAPTGVSI